MASQGKFWGYTGDAAKKNVPDIKPNRNPQSEEIQRDIIRGIGLQLGYAVINAS